MNVEDILKVAGEIAKRDYKVLQKLAASKPQVIREMTAGERQASRVREVLNNSEEKL